MDKRTKELIAIGASIAAHCQPCLKYHLEEAARIGINEEEINLAIAIGRTIEKSALKTMDDFSKEQVELINLSKTEVQSKKINNCCCNSDSCCS